jgi:succinate-acetate transporter protein
LGWQGAGCGGAATIGTYYFFGGMLQVIGSILEWFIGNTFPFIVFGSFGMLSRVLFPVQHARLIGTGAFWLAFAATLTPAYNAEAAFTAGATTAAEKAAGVASFEASLDKCLSRAGCYQN